MITQPGDGTDASGCARTRVSDADRERAIDVLKAAFAEGRLTREEHAERVERAYGSRTYAELAAVSGDLPAGRLGALPSPAQRGQRRNGREPGPHPDHQVLDRAGHGRGPAGVLPAAVGPLAAPVAVAGYRRPSLGLPLAGLFWLAFGWTVALEWGKLSVWGRR